MIYIVSGEPYQASQFVKQIKEQKLKEEFEYYSFDKEEMSNDLEKKLLELLGTPSLFQKPKFVILRDHDFEFSKHFLEMRAEKIGANDILFLTTVKKRISWKDQNISLHHFEMPTGNALGEFIKKEFLMRNIKPNSMVIKILTLSYNRIPDLYPVINEIEKISLAPHTWKELLTIENQVNPFALTDAFVKKERALALKLLESEFLKGTKPLDIVNRILWQLRILLLVSEAKKLQATSYKLTIHPFVMKKASQALKLFSLDEVKNLYTKAISLYERILFSSLPSEFLLFQFFWQI